MVSGTTCKIIVRHSGKVLDVSGASTADAATVIQWSWSGGGNEHWSLVKQ
nr:RICIN domain-containing protein [Paenibacillus andongensis]